MYIQSDFAIEEQQEDRRKKGSLVPWLVGGGLAAGAGVALAISSKGKSSQGNKEFDDFVKKVIVRDGANEAQQLIKQQQILNEIKKADQGKLATGYKGLSKNARKAKIANRKSLLREGTEQIESSLKMDKPDASTGSYRYINNKAELPPNIRKSINKTSGAANKLGVLNAQNLAKQRGIEYMRYTTTANFAMAGSIKTGVLSRITGQLGSTVDKAKNWLQKAQKTKQQVGAVKQKPTFAEIAKQRYGSAGVEIAPSLPSTIGKKPARNDLAERAALRTKLTEGSARQINRGSVDRYSKSGSQARINDNRTLRLKYTKDPRTGRLVSAAYNASLSLLCDL
jgi:hypothetical protein